MMLLSLLSYVDRSVLAILSPTILADLHLSVTQYGYAVSVFSICYMLANPIWGYWIDRRGLWVSVLVAVSVWSLASGSHALMLGLGGMCLARGLLGFGEGATFPAGLATVAETLPPERRSFGLGLAYSGGSLGAALTPLLITPIAIRYGWRPTFLLTGLLGFLWIALWFVLRATGIFHTKASAARPLLSVATNRWNRNLFATAAIYGLGAAPLAFGLYAAPLYLSRVLHVSQASLGHLLWIPPAGWEAGYLFWGQVADRRNARSLRNALNPTRPTILFTCFCVAGFLITLAPRAAASPYPVAATMLIFFLQMFIAGGFVVLSLSDGMAHQPRQSAGLLAGVAISSWALVTGILIPILGRFFDHFEYQRGFWLVAALPVCGMLLWKLLSDSTYSSTAFSE
ncbi:MAG: putative arabinose efflux permease, family [Acidobacteriaceae bacterium]|nr:putative arabinose efflux permease, family [Acidobacteriaceae bacterium]